MTELNPQAIELNDTIKTNNAAVLDMLSDKGKAIFFPKKGILAQAADAKGKEINATIGMALEDDGSPLVLNTVAKHVDLSAKDVFLYASSYGKPEMRKKWKEVIQKKNPSINSETSVPITTCGLSQAISMVGYMFVNPGEKVILPAPFWGNYKLMLINGYGANLTTFPAFEGKGFNLNGLKEMLNSEGDKKILFLNFPNNPTGYTPTNEEVKEIVATIKDAAESGKKIVVWVDDAYFGLVYEDGIYTQSIFSELCDLHENVLAVKIDGATKEDYVWGFRTGFITYGMKNATKELYTALEDKTAGAIRGNISMAPVLSQSLVLKSLEDPDYDAQKKEKFETLKRRYVKVKEIINSHPEYAEEFEPLPFNSGYFMCVKTKKDSEQLRQILLSDYSTGLIAIPGMLRIAFSCTPFDKLEKLFDNVYQACKKV